MFRPAKHRFLSATLCALALGGWLLLQIAPGIVVWAAGEHGGGDSMPGMGGGGGDGATAAGLQVTYAAFPGEPKPSEVFQAIFIITNDREPVTASPTLTYEFITDEAAKFDVDTARATEVLPGVYEVSLSLKYAGQYRLTLSYLHDDANHTNTFIQEITHPHSHQDGLAGEELRLDLHNINDLTAATGQEFEFDVDPAAAAAEITVRIQDQSGLLDLGTRTLTVNAEGHYVTPADIDFSADAPKWDITIETVNYGTKTFTIHLPK